LIPDDDISELPIQRSSSLPAGFLRQPGLFRRCAGCLFRLLSLPQAGKWQNGERPGYRSFGSDTRASQQWLQVSVVRKAVVSTRDHPRVRGETQRVTRMPWCRLAPSSSCHFTCVEANQLVNARTFVYGKVWSQMVNVSVSTLQWPQYTLHDTARSSGDRLAFCGSLGTTCDSQAVASKSTTALGPPRWTAPRPDTCMKPVDRGMVDRCPTMADVDLLEELNQPFPPPPPFQRETITARLNTCPESESREYRLVFQRESKTAPVLR
jgi:hypothetical protein